MKPVSLIYRHNPTGGKIYQCGASEIPDTLKNKQIDLLILAAQEYQPKSIDKNNEYFQVVKKLYVPLRDSSIMSAEEQKKTLEHAMLAANHAIKTILDGGNVISSCYAGLNRSGLVTSLVVKKLANCSGKKAIRLVRNNRSPVALFNPLFVRQILSI